MNVDDLVTLTDTPDLTDHPGRVIVTIPSHLTTVEELYAFYGSVLGRDGYFGRNSPAFVDCLTDPGWHARPWREIVVWHPSLPRLGKRALGQYFLDVLFALRRMHERSGHAQLHVRVVFHCRARRRLLRWSRSGRRWLDITG